MLLQSRFILLSFLIPFSAIVPAPSTSPAVACTQPSLWDLEAAFDIAANGVPQDAGLPPATTVTTVPPSLLKAVGWVESGWRQFAPSGRPLLSPDFGYGIMQITSGMAGAFGSSTGNIDPAVQSRIAADYRYNIAFGARMLEDKWTHVPLIGDGDPTAVENWYYALWAYNGWGWVNNPNNPRFSRAGTPGKNPSAFPYQERVLYLVVHPPKGPDGHPLWQPVKVTLPSRATIGASPHSFIPKKVHHQAVAALSAIYEPAPIGVLAPSDTSTVKVRLINTGAGSWITTGSGAVNLTYHVLTSSGDPTKPISPFSPGVVAYGQSPTPLPRDVLPGHSITVAVTVRAPAIAGKYQLVWDLESAADTWLSQSGVAPRAETLTVTATPTGASAATPTPTPRPQRLRAARFVADTSVPDGTVIASRSRFIKGWLIYNGGRSAWVGGYRLVQASGASFRAKTIAVPDTPACATVNLLVPMVAPSKPGSYLATWRMLDPAGKRFGDKLTVVITVRRGSPPPVPSMTPTPIPRGTARPTPTATPSG